MSNSGPAGHVARKRFGQNFLTDAHWIDKIAEAINAKEGERIIEIGPGKAALTERLIAAAKHVSAVEIDRDLAGWLRTQFDESALELILADALTLDWKELASQSPLRVVGNLPYNISSPLLFRLMDAAEDVVDQHFLLQREVVDRMVAAPGSKTYGRLSVMLQARYRMQKLFEVPPGAFSPAPQVVSAVVRMVPKTKDEVPDVNPELFASVVAHAFSQRRKTLRNALSRLLDAKAIEAAGVDSGLRAEALPLEAFIALTQVAEGLGVQPIVLGL